VLLLLTIALVLVGAVSLVVGFVSQNTLPIYISIACSVAAGLVLLVFSRINRRQATVVPATPTPAVDDAGGPATTEYVLQEARAAARPPVDENFPIEDYDQLLVSEIVPLLPELDLEELDQVRAREEDGKARASILRRIDGLAAELEGTAAPAAADEEEEPVADDELFPIADYDDLRVNQILPLLPELDDDELAVVADRERSGANRASVLLRVDELLGVTVVPTRRAAPKKAPVRRAGGAQSTQKAAAKKTAAKKAPAKTAAKKSAPKKTAAKKTAAKKPAAKKAAAAKKR
jgi:hypothetical protein